MQEGDQLNAVQTQIGGRLDVQRVWGGEGTCNVLPLAQFTGAAKAMASASGAASGGEGIVQR